MRWIVQVVTFLAVLIFLAPFSTAASYSLTTLFTFDNGNNGGNPLAPLIADPQGNLYGTTLRGGANNFGTVFRLDGVTHTLSTLVTFDGANGRNPFFGQLAFDAAGDLFGTTNHGGAYGLDVSGYGTVFRLNLQSQQLTTIRSFDRDENGVQPLNGLAVDADDNIYGTTVMVGVPGEGTIFRLKAGSREFSKLFTFTGVNGSDPGCLISDGNGNLFGTTRDGGANGRTDGSNGYGTVFRFDLNTQQLTTLFSFDGINGDFPARNLYIDSHDNIYGSTEEGGDYDRGTIFRLEAESYALTTLAHFDGANGTGPVGNLVADADGNLYGMTDSGGDHNMGTIFQLPANTNTIVPLISFDGANGAFPDAGLIIDANGSFYGATSEGGAYNRGTVFRLSPVPEPHGMIILAGAVSTLLLRRPQRLSRPPFRRRKSEG